MSSRLQGRHFLKEFDFSKDDMLFLLEVAATLKRAKCEGIAQPRLAGKQLALIFEKTSTRTRCAFEVAAKDLGAHTTYLGPGESQIGSKESMEDTARVLGRLYDGIEYRGFAQDTVETLAQYAGVPVWNGLTDEFHPTQSLCDVFTMHEACVRPLHDISFCYLGDTRNNVARSLLAMGALLGMDVRLAGPPALWPVKEFVAECSQLALGSDARLCVTEDAREAVRGVDFVYTDVWVSMGEPVDTWSERIDMLRPYQVNWELLESTGNWRTRFMHCLPALHNRRTRLGEQIFQQHHLDGLEVTEDVFESAASIVFRQAENRMHTIKAVLVATLGA